MKAEIPKIGKYSSKSKQLKNKIRSEKVKKAVKCASLELLKLVANIAEATFMIADKKALYRYAYGFGWNNQELSRGIYELKKTNYITVDNSTTQQSIELTNKAKIKTVEIIAKKLLNEEKLTVEGINELWKQFQSAK